MYATDGKQRQRFIYHDSKNTTKYATNGKNGHHFICLDWKPATKNVKHGTHRHHLLYHDLKKMYFSWGVLFGWCHCVCGNICDGTFLILAQSSGT